MQDPKEKENQSFLLKLLIFIILHPLNGVWWEASINISALRVAALIRPGAVVGGLGGVDDSSGESAYSREMPTDGLASPGGLDSIVHHLGESADGDAAHVVLQRRRTPHRGMQLLLHPYCAQ